MSSRIREICNKKIAMHEERMKKRYSIKQKWNKNIKWKKVALKTTK